MAKLTNNSKEGPAQGGLLLRGLLRPLKRAAGHQKAHSRTVKGQPRRRHPRRRPHDAGAAESAVPSGRSRLLPLVAERPVAWLVVVEGARRHLPPSSLPFKNDCETIACGEGAA